MAAEKRNLGAVEVLLTSNADSNSETTVSGGAGRVGGTAGETGRGVEGMRGEDQMQEHGRNGQGRAEAGKNQWLGPRLELGQVKEDRPACVRSIDSKRVCFVLYLTEGELPSAHRLSQRTHGHRALASRLRLQHRRTKQRERALCYRPGRVSTQGFPDSPE